MIYNDRNQAGKLLAYHLKSNLGKIGAQNTVVVGLARGGVPIAGEIAREFGCGLDALVVKKIGHPENPEYAIAAVTQDEIFLNADIQLPTDYLKLQAKRNRDYVTEKNKLYHANRKSISYKDKLVILVDDGLATGLSMRCAIAQVRREHPKTIYVAVPVGAIDSLKDITKDAEKVFSLYTPMTFASVGQFYKRFNQLTDEKVIDALTA